MNPRRSSLLATIALAAFLWLFVCGALLLMLWPWRPTTPLQWVLFVAIGPLAYGAAEYLGERVLSPGISARISTRRFSWLRIAYALLMFLAFLAVVFGVLWLLGGRLSAQ